MDNFQLTPEHVHYQQQYLNFAYQMLQQNCQLNNNQIQQQSNCTSSFNNVNINNNNNNNNNNNKLYNHMSTSHQQQQQQQIYDVYNNNCNKLPTYQQNILQQQLLSKSYNYNINDNNSSSINSNNNSLFMDNSQYWSPTYSQYYTQSQHQTNLYNQQSINLGQYIAKISQPLAVSTNINQLQQQQHSSNLPPSYQNLYNINNQNQDFIINDLSTRIHFESKLLKTKDTGPISTQNTNIISKCDTSSVTKIQVNNNNNNNFFTSSSPSFDLINSSPHNQYHNTRSSFLNDSGFNSNPSSVESTYSSKQSNISDLSTSFDDHLNELDCTQSSIETNIKTLTIQEKNKNEDVKKIDEESNNNSSLNVFICWMDNDESQLSEFDLQMREILKQQAALNLYISNSNDDDNSNESLSKMTTTVKNF